MDFRKFVVVCIEIEWSAPNFGKLRNRVMAWRGRDRDLKPAGAPRSVSMRTSGVVLRMPCCRIAERGQAITRGRHGAPPLSAQSHPTGLLGCDGKFKRNPVGFPGPSVVGVGPSASSRNRSPLFDISPHGIARNIEWAT